MKQTFAELFIWVSVIALNIAKAIYPRLTMDYMAFMTKEFLKENVDVVELEIDGKRTTVTPEVFGINRKSDAQ